MTSSLEIRRKKIYQQALRQKYVGCAFDIDGTLTERGEEFIPSFMIDKLAELTTKVPVAICSARKLEHARAKIDPLFKRSSDPKTCRENFIFLCENGSIGYYFDPKSQEYKEFYRVDYPYARSHFKKLFQHLQKVLEPKLGSAFTCEVSMIFRPIRVNDPDREALATRSHKLGILIKKELKKLDHKKALRIGNSGIGITIFPAAGDKDNGTRMFAEYVRTSKNLKISKNAKELIVVGDQPLGDGNDHAFLKGKYGTPFTVGKTDPKKLLPLPVYNARGKIIHGPEATATLLKNLQF